MPRDREVGERSKQLCDETHHLTSPGAISSVIAGQYMTRYGAKVPLLVALIGSVGTSFGDLYTFYDMESPLYVNILTAIPQAVTGD